MAFPDDILTDSPSPLDQLRVAFAMRIARDIVAADGILDTDEIRLLTSVFPDKLMKECGFLDADTQLSKAYHRAYLEAVEVLPRILDTPQKLSLITLFHEACLVDGELHPAEMEVLQASAEALQLSPTDLHEHLLKLPGNPGT